MSNLRCYDALLLRHRHGCSNEIQCYFKDFEERSDDENCNCFHFHYVAFLFYAHPSILIDIEFVDTFFAAFVLSISLILFCPIFQISFFLQENRFLGAPHGVWKGQEIVSETSYIFILSGQKWTKNDQNGPFRRLFQKFAVKKVLPDR